MRFSSKCSRAVSSLSIESCNCSILSLSAWLDSRAAASWMKSSCTRDRERGKGEVREGHARQDVRGPTKNSTNTRNKHQHSNASTRRRRCAWNAWPFTAPCAVLLLAWKRLLVKLGGGEVSCCVTTGRWGGQMWTATVCVNKLLD